MKHHRNIDKYTTAQEAKSNSLRSLAALRADTLANKSSLGYAAFPGYSFKAPQGAAFAAARLVRELKDEKLVRWISTSEPYSRYGYMITPKGREWLSKENHVA